MRPQLHIPAHYTLVEDQQIELVELGDGGFELELTTRDLKLLNEIGGSGEQNTPAVLDESKPDSCSEMRLFAAGRAKQQDIGTLCEPAVDASQRPRACGWKARSGRQLPVSSIPCAGSRWRSSTCLIATRSSRGRNAAGPSMLSSSSFPISRTAKIMVELLAPAQERSCERELAEQLAETLDAGDLPDIAVSRTLFGPDPARLLPRLVLQPGRDEKRSCRCRGGSL